MRSARVFFENDFTGQLIEAENGREYSFQYEQGYNGPPISLTMPVQEEPYRFNEFPPFLMDCSPRAFNLKPC